MKSIEELAQELEQARKRCTELEEVYKTALTISTRRQQTLEALKYTSLHLTGSMQLRSVLESILTVIFKLLPAYDAHIFLYENDKLIFGAVLTGGKPSDKPYSEPRQDGLTYTVARSCKLIIIEDINASPIYKNYNTKSVAGSIMGVPLKVGENLVGVMNVSFTEARSFSPDELAMMDLFALQAAIAIQNAQVYQAASHRLQTLEALKFTSLHLTGSMELRAILEAVGSVLFQLYPINDVQFFMYDGKNLLFGAALRNGKPVDVPFATPRREGTTYLVAQKGEKFIIENLKTHPHYAHYHRDKSNFWSNAMISVPLKIGVTVVGVMNIGFKEVHSFSQDELEMLDLFANQAAIAIENARVFARSQSYARQMEELREQERHYFEELNRTKDQLMSMASHDLKNPLGTVMMSLELLEMHGKLDDEKGQSYLLRIRRGAKRMLTLITDLLDIARLETGLALVMENILLFDFARNNLEDFSLAASKKKILLKLLLPETDVTITIDPKRMSQVLHNLLSNAIKYTPGGGQVKLIVSTTDKQVFFQVVDTGLGIPAEDIPHLFEKFHRVHTDEHMQEEGTGLGLSIVQSIVEQHGGSIEVESIYGKGSTFKIVLPIKTDS